MSNLNPPKILASIRPEALLCHQRGGKHIYLVSGRIVGSDDDSAFIVQAEDDDAAYEVLESTLIDEASLAEDDVASLAAMNDGKCYYACCCYVIADLEEGSENAEG